VKEESTEEGEHFILKLRVMQPLCVSESYGQFVRTTLYVICRSV
jgi:hypothetical protein